MGKKESNKVKNSFIKSTSLLSPYLLFKKEVIDGVKS